MSQDTSIGDLLAAVVTLGKLVQVCEDNLRAQKEGLAQAEQVVIDHMIDNEIESITMFGRRWAPSIDEYAQVVGGANDTVVEWLVENVPGAASKIKQQMHHKSRDSLLRGELFDEDSGEWIIPPELSDCVRVNPVRRLGSRKT